MRFERSTRCNVNPQQRKSTMLRLSDTKPDRKSRMEFFRLKGRVARAVPSYAKEHGLGPEYRLLQQIILASTVNNPWAWMVLKDQAHSAEKLGFATSTFKRHLSRLREQGLLVGHHVTHHKAAVPCFTVAPAVLEALSVVSK